MKKTDNFGFNERIENLRIEENVGRSEVGRIIQEHKERYIVLTEDGEKEAEVTGNLRFAAAGREDFPAVGDWVFLKTYDNDFVLIYKIMPRTSVIKRQAVGAEGEVQVIAANVDYAFLVQAIDRDFNINRLERYMTICNSSRVKSIIVLTKTDLADDLKISEITAMIKERISDVPVVAVSNRDLSGYDTLKNLIRKDCTYCMLGSSGVGKSTLLNNLTGTQVMKTGSISDSTKKGRHITSHREMVILDGGGLLIDNPGMKEVGIADSEDGLETTFDSIVRLSQHCRFLDCTHTTESGCRVLEAVEKGEINKLSYENYLRMLKEKAHFDSTVAERRKKDKAFGKMMKNYKKDMKNK